MTYAKIIDDRKDARKRFEHNMAVYSRGGSPDEYIKPPKRKAVVSISDFANVPGFAEGMAEFYKYCEER